MDRPFPTMIPKYNETKSRSRLYFAPLPKLESWLPAVALLYLAQWASIPLHFLNTAKWNSKSYPTISLSASVALILTFFWLGSVVLWLWSSLLSFWSLISILTESQPRDMGSNPVCVGGHPPDPIFLSYGFDSLSFYLDLHPWGIGPRPYSLGTRNIYSRFFVAQREIRIERIE